jgi:hypothetical protein
MNKQDTQAIINDHVIEQSRIQSAINQNLLDTVATLRKEVEALKKIIYVSHNTQNQLKVPNSSTDQA